MRLTSGIEEIARKSGMELAVSYIGGMFGIFFGAKTPPQNYREVMAGDLKMFTNFFQILLNAGIYIAPSPYESGFVSGAHSDEIIERTLHTIENALVM